MLLRNNVLSIGEKMVNIGSVVWEPFWYKQTKIIFPLYNISIEKKEPLKQVKVTYKLDTNS